MDDVRRILCPTDLSPCAARALGEAAALARLFGAELDVLHVVSRPPLGLEALSAPFGGPAGGRFVETLDGLTAAVRASGVPCGALLREGDPAAAVVQTAESLEADLIVMGAHGGLGGAAWFLGSVTEKVLRTAPCPVLTVGTSVMPADGVSCRVVLCPLDFSPTGSDTVGYASEVAARAGAELVLVHVIEAEVFASPPLPASYDVAGLRDWMLDAARERLRAIAAALPSPPPRVRVHARFGKPYREILQAARDERADLVVVGVRGTSPLQYGIFGSTASQLVRQAPCPVLTVRPRLPRRRHEPMVDEQELVTR